MSINQPLYRRSDKHGVCPGCGKRATRSKIVLEPWYEGRAGTPFLERAARLDQAVAAWKAEPTYHAKCNPEEVAAKAASESRGREDDVAWLRKLSAAKAEHVGDVIDRAFWLRFGEVLDTYIREGRDGAY